MLPFIPAEAEIDALIASATNRLAVLLQILKETGARIGEVLTLRWTDVDTEHGIVTIRPEKGSDSRQIRISPKLCAMINNQPKKDLRIFPIKPEHIRRTIQRQRARIAVKLGNPRLTQIHFHTLRHWKATMEYQRTRDILYVMRLLGHKNIKNTLVYTRMVTFGADEYVCKVGASVNECSMLIESGFEFVVDLNGTKLFRKRK